MGNLGLLQFNRQRTKAFFRFLAIFLAPGLLMLIPAVNIFTIPIWVVWLMIPAIPLSVLGIRHYRFSEFGPTPEGAIDVLCIIAFWALAAFLLSWLTNRKKRPQAVQDQT